jgi:hypothetical protein
VDGSVSLAINFASGWEPDGARDGWKVSVDGEQGAASYSPELMDLALPAATILLALAALALIAVGRFRT